MKLYDECIGQVERLLCGIPRAALSPGSEEVHWPDVGKNQLIFRGDMAYELGGGNLPALSAVLLTDSETLVAEDSVILFGKDLPI